MKWNLNRIYPEEEAEVRWENDFIKARNMYLTGSLSEAEELTSYLWTYAYARNALDTREKGWLTRTERIDKLEQLKGLDDTVETTDPIEDARCKQKIIIDRIKEKRINNLTIFQASTSPDPLTRMKVYTYLNNAYKENLQKLSSLFIIVNQEEFAPSEIYALAREKVLALLPTLHDFLGKKARENGSGVLNWTDLNASSSWELNTNINLKQAKQRVRSIYYELNPDWGELIDELIYSGCVEAIEGTYKLQAGFSMPLAFNSLPLCYVHSIKGVEGVIGLLHELAHGLHFSLYKNKNKNFMIPESTVAEVFPMAMNLVGINKWFGTKAYYQRIVMSILMQFVWIEFKYQVNKVKVTNSCEIQNIWEDVYSFVFGRSLTKKKNENLLWCGNRIVWEESSVGQSYVCGSVTSTNLASALLTENNHEMIKKMSLILSMSPTITMQDYNKHLGQDLLF